MKNILSLLILIVSVTILYSCKNGNSPDFTEESFGQPIILSESQIYEHDSLIFNMPSWIRFHPDSFLIIQDMYTPKLIKILDLKNNTVQQVIRQGKGPGEMIVAWGIETVGKELYVYCGQLRKVIVLSPDNNRLFQVTDEYSLSENKTMDFYPLTKQLSACSTYFGDEKRLAILDGRGNILRKIGDYPVLYNSPGVKPDNDIFSFFLSGSPDGNKVVTACAHTDIIEIYDLTDDSMKRIKGPLGIQMSVKNVNAGAGSMVERDPLYLTYGRIDRNENEFWIGYCGLLVDRKVRPRPYQTSSQKIFCFDWQGNPVRSIVLNSSFIAFDVDWVGKVLYALEWHNEILEVVSYSLKDIIK